MRITPTYPGVYIEEIPSGVRGNFIRARREPDVYLDGDTFGDPQDEFGIRRPTGDGRRGGDFVRDVRVATTQSDRLSLPYSSLSSSLSHPSLALQAPITVARMLKESVHNL
jgi:hypothetical protein